MKLTQLHDELRYHTQAMLAAATRGNLDAYDEAFAWATWIGNALRIEMAWRHEMRPLIECVTTAKVASTDRMSCVLKLYPDKFVVTCTPLVTDVTKEELYDREAVLLMEIGPKVIALMNSLGAELRVKDMSIVRDHEEATNPDD